MIEMSPSVPLLETFSAPLKIQYYDLASYFGNLMIFVRNSRMTFMRAVL